MPNGARHYAFTLNNFSDDDISNLQTASESSEVGYLVFGKETSSTGTPHLQAHVYFTRQQSLRQAKTLLSVGAHFSVARNIQRSIDYCKKDGAYTEYGTPPTKQGKRCDLAAFRESVTDGITDLSVLRETHPSVMARFPRFAISVIRDLRPKVDVPTHSLRSWQTQLVALLSQEPDPRKIHFLVDKKGNAGKTYVCDFLESTKEKVQVMKPGKVPDMAYEYDEDTKVLIIDVPRSKMDKFEYMYSFLESIKDGRLFSSKYEPVTKRFKSPHLCVMMNEEPDYLALSEDRYDVIEIEI